MERPEFPLPSLAPANFGSAERCPAGALFGSAQLGLHGPTSAGAISPRSWGGGSSELFAGALWLGSCEPWLPKDGPQLSAVLSFAVVKTQRRAFREQNLDNRCGG